VNVEPSTRTEEMRGGERGVSSTDEKNTGCCSDAIAGP
jgi:hypothetical protein